MAVSATDKTNSADCRANRVVISSPAKSWQKICNDLIEERGCVMRDTVINNHYHPASPQPALNFQPNLNCNLFVRTFISYFRNTSHTHTVTPHSRRNFTVRTANFSQPCSLQSRELEVLLLHPQTSHITFLHPLLLCMPLGISVFLQAT